MLVDQSNWIFSEHREPPPPLPVAECDTSLTVYLTVKLKHSTVKWREGGGAGQSYF